MIAAICSAALLACSDLDLNPKDEAATGNWFQTPEQFEMNLNVLLLHMFWPQERLEWTGSNQCALDAITDDFTNRDKLLSFTNGSLNSTNPVATAMWDNTYTAINRCNKIITELHKVEAQMDPELRNRILGNARFYRACFYARLLMHFGDVVVVDENIDIESEEGRNAAYLLERTDRWSVLEDVLEEFDDVVEMLPREYSASEVQRATKGAAYGMKARFALYFASIRKWDTLENNGFGDADAAEAEKLFKEARDGAYLFNVPTGSIDDPYESRPQTYHRVDPLITAYLQDKTGTMVNTDWQDAIFRTAYSTKHSLSISGRTKSINYFVGANYLYREGTIIGSDFERYGLRVNLDGKRNRLKYGVSFSPSYSKSNYVDADAQYGGDGVIASALMAPPVFPVYNSDGSYNWDMNGFLRINTWDTQTNEVLNPVALALEIDDIREKLNILGNVFASYEFIKGLEYKITAGGDYYSYIRNYYRPSSLPLRGYKYLDAQSTPQANYYNNNYFHWTLSNQLSFNRSFGDHTINAVAVYEAEKYTTQTAQIVSTGTIGDDKIRSTKGKTIDQDNTYNNKYAYTFASWLLRAQYSYKGRYMASVSIRGDGSSRFAPNTRWGYFPAVSIGWRISDENFMRGIKWIDDMKFRASIGQTGNAQIGNSEYLALYGTTNIDLGNGLTSQVYPKQIANNDLGWEKNTQYNVGVDISLWRGLLGLNADFYYSKTTDMLFDVPVSSVSGLTTSNMNIGSMQNKGVELSLSSRRSFGDFSYAVSANWSLNRNKVLSLGDENADIIKESSYAGGYYITRVGQPVGCYYLMVQDGIFHNQEELNSYPHFDTTQVGDFRFVDANGNGILEKDADRVIVGNYMPDFYYGFSVNLSWKGFDLAAAFQGVYGNEILNLERRYLLNMEASSNMMRESLQRYPYGELNRATRKSSGNNGACTSTFHLEDGSYLRLQNLSLGYTFPDKWTRRAGISKLRIYVQGSNLFTWTDYSGYNPEVNKRAADALRPGEDYCSYPLSRTFSVGINFNL